MHLNPTYLVYTMVPATQLNIRLNTRRQRCYTFLHSCNSHKHSYTENHSTAIRSRLDIVHPQGCTCPLACNVHRCLYRDVRNSRSDSLVIIKIYLNSLVSLISFFTRFSSFQGTEVPVLFSYHRSPAYHVMDSKIT